MLAYPVNQGGQGSVITVVPDSGIQKTPMSEGAESAHTDFVGVKFRLTIAHWWLGQADRDAIFAFFDAAPTAVHSVVTELEGSYNCTFNNRPKLTDKSGGLAKIVSELSGVMAASSLTVLGDGGASFSVGVTLLGDNGKTIVLG